MSFCPWYAATVGARGGVVAGCSGGVSSGVPGQGPGAEMKRRPGGETSMLC